MVGGLELLGTIAMLSYIDDEGGSFWEVRFPGIRRHVGEDDNGVIVGNAVDHGEKVVRLGVVTAFGAGEGNEEIGEAGA